jgi:DNA-binding NtrC family response regulator
VQDERRVLVWPVDDRNAECTSRRMADLLIVDDNIDLAQLLEQLLRDEGHEVRVAHDGETSASICSRRVT